ncbi:sensor histidine kinase [Streptomyces sp. SID10853]|uniref:sensor histidine kinase n=1 Tax=Streptomyces sp. SID10853 TaxID=2706028 RepID=UPI0013BFEB50|nr:sensor histidine kinase [Streptomyces sp. SID10853]NDZ82329.1 sensor histidine kinase [Streptomyces sp. SID10853]
MTAGTLWRTPRLRGAKEAGTAVLRAAGAAIGELAGGFGTALPALALLILLLLTAVLSLTGTGLLLVGPVLGGLHALARRERRRLARRGHDLIAPDPPPTRPRAGLVHPTTRREMRWLLQHASAGLLLALTGIALPVLAVRDTAFPLYWRFAPKDTTAASIGIGTAHTWLDAIAVSLLGVGWIALILGLTPALARLQARPARRFLAADPGTDLSVRILELTASRAAALDAHAAELRRIERALHDGSQNRLISVTVLLGAARRRLSREPDPKDEVIEILERAHSAAEQALADLRGVSRSILPPVLEAQGLAGALAGLAADCAVPCRTDVDVPVRCAVSAEATAYFVVAEALTNITKHSGAQQAAVSVRSDGVHLRLTITDDGRGGADEDGGSGLTGIRRRVEAHDGTLRLASPAGGPTTLEVVLPCGT